MASPLYLSILDSKSLIWASITILLAISIAVSGAIDCLAIKLEIFSSVAYSAISSLVIGVIISLANCFCLSNIVFFLPLRK